MSRKVCLLLCSLLILVLAACGGEQAPETIQIGAVVPISGSLAGGGGQVERGYQIAVEDINAAGGIYVKEFDKKIPIELTLLDDESDPNKLVTLLESLNSDQKVVAYLGGFGSGQHAAAAAIAEKNKIPYIGVAFALYAPHGQGYKYLFSPFPKSQDMASDIFAMLNEYLPDGERPTRVAVFQEQTDWGVELGDLWREQAAAQGYEIVVYEEYSVGSSDFTDIILKAKEADAELLLSLPTPPDGITIQRQMAELDYTPKFQFTIRAPDVPTWKDLGEAGDYVALAPGWFYGMAYDGVAELNEKHMEMTDRPADPIVGPAYAAVQILADAIERAGSLDRDAIRDAIAATDMDTVVGPVTFREDGTGVVNAPILQYQHGTIELIYPSEFATAEMIYPIPPVSER
ncbi:MAG: amino acid ABC transporter substrate-binding protein [Anaerolineales bacterium]|nr:amino acid ABC transporter substrate-binding protein [Anaerolineales bacterium]